MHEQDKLTGQQLGIDPVSQEQMDQAWHNYRHGTPAQSDAERDLHREWAQLDSDVMADVWEMEAEDRAMELYTDAEIEHVFEVIADLHDGQPDRESVILAAMLADPDVAATLGQILSSEMLHDDEYRILFEQLAQTPGWSREPISEDTIAYLSGLAVRPGEAIELAREMLAMHVRWTLIDQHNEQLLAQETPALIDPGLQTPQHIDTVTIRA